MSLMDELQEQVLAARQRGSGRVEFLVVKDEIQQALESGYSALQIWRQLRQQQKISIQYRMFKRYVDRFLSGEKPTPVDTITRPTITKSVGPTRVHVERPKRFEHDATPMSLDELV